ncbi:MAG: 4'-phosphopantetheinyl transferase superfamily protein [Gemmatimonadetes bacterium]|nr:4'-phosphopantetheinyl transferase superfamily protein [Gemmatimonadota bacterium]
MTIDVLFVELGELPLHPVWSEDEAARATAMPSVRARQAHLIMRHVLRHALGHRMGVPPEALHFCHGRLGKPYITGHAHAPAFSVSHTLGCGVIAIADGRPVGVDVEVREPRLPGAEALATFLAPAERDRLLALDPSARATHFARLWTRREAVVKLHGGSVATFAEACMIRGGRVVWTPAAAGVEADVTPGGEVVIRTLRTPTGYVGALASLGDSVQLRYLPRLRGPIPEHDLDRGAADVGRPVVAGEVEGGDQSVKAVVQLAQHAAERSPVRSTGRRGGHQGPQERHRDQA